MIYQITLGGPRGPKIRSAVGASMSIMRLLGLKMGLRDGLGTHVCSSELCLDVIFVISSHFGSFFCKKWPNFIDFNASKPSISLERVVKIEVFIIFILTCLFISFYWPLGPHSKSLGLLFAAIWGPLGLSWPPLGGTCDALSGIWEVFFQHLVPNVPPGRSPSPPGVHKRPPETPQKSPEGPQSHPKSSQKNPKCLPKRCFINILTY